MIPDAHRKALLSSDTSRLNKIHLAIGWAHFHRWFIEYRWKGAFLRSRLEFRFAPEESFVQAKSFDEDVLPQYEGV
jgi:hypothetical protein